MSETNETPYDQRGMCRYCAGTLHRLPGGTLWLDAFRGEECTAAPLRDGDFGNPGDPGHHNPITILNKPADPPPTGPGPAPVVPNIPRMGWTKGPW